MWRIGTKSSKYSPLTSAKNITHLHVSKPFIRDLSFIGSTNSRQHTTVFDQKDTFFRVQYGGVLYQTWAAHGLQEWERIVNSLMSIMFPGSPPVGAQYPASSMASGYPSSRLGDGDTASTSFNMAPLLPGEDEEEEAGTPTARSPVFDHLGGRFGNDHVPSSAVDPILRSGVPTNDDIPGILDSSALTLPPFRTGEPAFGIYQSVEFQWGEHRPIESPPDTTM